MVPKVLGIKEEKKPISKQKKRAGTRSSQCAKQKKSSDKNDITSQYQMTVVIG